MLVISLDWDDLVMMKILVIAVVLSGRKVGTERNTLATKMLARETVLEQAVNLIMPIMVPRKHVTVTLR